MPREPRGGGEGRTSGVTSGCQRVRVRCGDSPFWPLSAIPATVAALPSRALPVGPGRARAGLSWRLAGSRDGSLRLRANALGVPLPVQQTSLAILAWHSYGTYVPLLKPGAKCFWQTDQVGS